MTTLSAKKVSVIIPNYNYAEYIDKRIDSVVNQTYPIYELIILDDCSMDKSVKVIEAKIHQLSILWPELKVKFIKNEKNSGKAMRQWKKGIEEATGDYIWIAEADDLCKKTFLEEVMKGFEDKDVVLSYAESAVIGVMGVTVAPNFRWSRDKEKTGRYKQSYIKDGKTEVEEILAIRCSIPNVSAVVFKNASYLTKYIDEALKFSQVGDWYFYVKVLENGKIAYNRKSLNKFRLHRGSVTRTISLEKHFNEVKEMQDMIVRDFDVSEKVRKMMAGEAKRISNKLGQE